jgi:polysaccharide biosynthesis transport protein
MELRQYWTLFLKWWWLFLLCAVVGGGSAYLVNANEPPTYQASTLLIIGGSVDSASPSSYEMFTSQRLAQTYAELIKTRPILEATQQSLGLSHMPRVSVSLVRDTELMRITVVDTVPSRAAATANELARQLIKSSPSDPEGREQGYRDFVQVQLEEIRSEVSLLTEALLTEQQAGNGNSERLLRLQQELNTRRANYAQLLSFANSSSVNYIRVVEEALTPTGPSSPNVRQNTMLAAVVGLMLAGGVAFLIEYLDDSVKGQADVEAVLGLPTLGVLSELENATNGNSPPSLALNHPFSPFVESFRMLRTRLRYSLDSNEPRVFLVTSVAPGEGKTTTVANLAVVTAQSGLKTLAIDADLRRPTLHKALGANNDVGLSTYIVGEATSPDAVIQTTHTDDLWFMASGMIPPNPAELLNSPRMAELLQQLSDQFDVILLDSPPILGVADANILASLASGTILVAEVGRTRLESCLRAVAQVDQVEGKLLGVVLNRLNARGGGYYCDYHHYSSYYGQNGNGDGANGHHDGIAARLKRLLPGQQGHPVTSPPEPVQEPQPECPIQESDKDANNE